ncbi:MAG TPA: thioredoxin family protein [Acidimicrobiia bacterium]|nr:thioredoxin family protein [Acidimicrobiia bacterium]
MAAVGSTMLPLGTAAPDFALEDPHGRTWRLDDYAGSPALLVAFICNHCPYVKHIRRALAEVTERYQRAGVSVVGINSNAATHPDDSVEAMRTEVAEAGYTFPYLVDSDQVAARAYRAACTPDFFLFDADRALVYRGQFDSSRPGGDAPADGSDLAAAVEAVLAGRPVPGEQRPSIGCNIKWIPGNEPDWHG